MSAAVHESAFGTVKRTFANLTEEQRCTSTSGGVEVEVLPNAWPKRPRRDKNQPQHNKRP